MAGKAAGPATRTREGADLFVKRTRHLKGDKILFSGRPIKDERIISLTPKNFYAWLKERR